MSVEYRQHLADTVGRPLTRQRSAWQPRPDLESRLPRVLLGALVYVREVGDGSLRAIVNHEPSGWHLSISFVDRKGKPSRYPRWDEIADARYRLLPDQPTMAMLLPPPEQYVAVHDSTFHLHEIERDAS